MEDDDFSRPETSTSSDFVTESRSAALQEAESSAVRRRHHSLEVPDAKRQMKDVFSLLNGIIAERASVKEDDEYDLYGKLIAKRIRKLPEHERDFIMHDIDGIFIKRHHKYLSSVLSSSEMRERFPPNATACTPTVQVDISPPTSPPKLSSHSITQSVQIESDPLTLDTSE